MMMIMIICLPANVPIIITAIAMSNSDAIKIQQLAVAAGYKLVFQTFEKIGSFSEVSAENDNHHRQHHLHYYYDDDDHHEQTNSSNAHFRLTILTRKCTLFEIIIIQHVRYRSEIIICTLAGAK